MESENQSKQQNTHTENKSSSNTSTQDYKVTEKQLSRMFAIAYKKGITAEKVKEQVLKKFNKDVKELTKSEYDRICDGYENIKVS